MTPLLLDFTNACALAEADPDAVMARLKASPDVQPDFVNCMEGLMHSSVLTMGGPVYAIPLMQPVAASSLARLAQDLPFTPNPTEGRDYQIPEAVLADVAPLLGQQLLDSLMPTINAYSLLVYSRPIKRVVSLQFAKYSPEGTPGTGWHHDTQSDVSVVVSLNPDDFEGGGTGLRLGPEASIEIKPLPSGWALFFNGKTIHHRGLPVTSGERLLLVFWCSTSDEK